MVKLTRSLELELSYPPRWPWTLDTLGTSRLDVPDSSADLLLDLSTFRPVPGKIHRYRAWGSPFFASPGTRDGNLKIPTVCTPLAPRIFM